MTIAARPSQHEAQQNRLTGLRKDIESAINRHSAENGSDTPDFILAEFLMSCLAAFDHTTRRRDGWRSSDVAEPETENPK